MNATAARLFSALDSAHANTTATAAALGMSKQAYSVARQRVSMSDDAAIRAAALLRLDPAETLAALHRDAATTPEARAAWERIFQRLANSPEPCTVSTTKTNDDSTNKTSNKTPSDLYYVKFAHKLERQLHGGWDLLGLIHPKWSKFWAMSGLVSGLGQNAPKKSGLGQQSPKRISLHRTTASVSPKLAWRPDNRGLHAFHANVG